MSVLFICIELRGKYIKGKYGQRSRKQSKTLWPITKLIFKSFVFRYASASAQYITRRYNDFVRELCVCFNCFFAYSYIMG